MLGADASRNAEAAPVRDTRARDPQTGLPNRLKSNVEAMSGLSLSDVRVHYRSSEPAKVAAHAFTRGPQIHIAPGREHDLPHEAWHVVQQKQGRVAATSSVAGQPLNEDGGLEREADVMGSRAKNLQVEGRAAATPQATKGSSVQRRPVIQRAKNNEILSHIYEVSESPLKTVTRFIALNTGHSFAEVLGAYTKSAFDSSYRDTMVSGDANYRPFSVKAVIHKVTGSASRPSSSIQTGIGKLGPFEDLIRGRSVGTYDGGHLLGYGWFSGWPLINSAMNIAPQSRDENRAIFGYHGAWGGEEIESRDIVDVLPLRVTASVSYASTTYTASLAWLAEALLAKGSAPRKTVESMYTGKLRYTTINTRIPSLYALDYVPADLKSLVVGKDDLGKINNDNADGRLPYSVAVRDLAGPVLDLWLRMYDPWSKKGRQYRSTSGGGVVSHNQSDALIGNVVAELANGVVGGAMLVHQLGYDLSTSLKIAWDIISSHAGAVDGAAAMLLGANAAAVVPWVVLLNSYLGQGTVVSVLQQAVRLVASDSGAANVDLVLNVIEGNLLTPVTTARGLVSLSKSTLATVTNLVFLAADYAGYGAQKLKGD